MTDIRRVHHRSSSRHEYDYDYDYDYKSKHKPVSSRVVKKDLDSVSSSSRRIKLTVTAPNDRRSSISPSPQRPRAPKRSKSRSRSKGRAVKESKSKKQESQKAKKSPSRDHKTKSKESEKKIKVKKKSRSRSRTRSRSNSLTRYHNYPPHYYYENYYPPYPDSRSRSRSISRSKSRSPEPYRSKPGSYPVGYYPPGPPPSRFRHPYPGMRYPAPPPGVPYYPPPPGYMPKFSKFPRPRFFPPQQPEEGEGFYPGIRFNPNYKTNKKEDTKEVPDMDVLEEPKSPSATDPELTDLVGEITTAIANASAEGKEYILSEEQKNTLQRHQQVLQEYQQKKQKYQQLMKLRQQSQLNQEQMSALLANKKFPNYRLLGRNIFEPNVKQKFFQKRIKTNTYYSRFIKQHPTNNLPLVFQKTTGMADEKEEVPVEELKKKKKKSKKKKKLTSSESSSDSTDDEKKLKKKIELEDGQIQPTGDSDSSSSSSSSSRSSGSSSDSSSDSSTSSDNGSDKKSKKKKRKNKFNNDARNGHTDSDSSMLDLKENLKPIGSYIKDRERMLNEMFRCIKGSKLRAMLPDILKTRQLREVKERCLEALECMSKKRIRCLLTDQPMLSSSGTEESSEDEYDTSFNSDSDRSVRVSTSKLKQKTNGNESKFKPIGADSFKQIEEPNQDESNEDSQNSQPSKEEKSTTASKATSGIAAAGFKNFVKKSISIKIKTNDQLGGSSPSETTTLQSSTTQLTELQKQKMAISNKLAKKIKTDTTTTVSSTNLSHFEESKPVLTIPKTSSDLATLRTVQSAQQLQQLQQQQQQQQPPGGQGLLPTPNVPPIIRPGFMPVPPPNNFSYPPPNVRMAAPGVQPVTGVPNTPPPGMMTRPHGVYAGMTQTPNNPAVPMSRIGIMNQPPPVYQNMPSQIPQTLSFQPQGQSLLGPVPTHLPPQYQFNQRYQNEYADYIDEEDEYGNEDAAYDLDDNAYNYDIDEDLDSIINDQRSRKREKESKRKSKKSSKKHKRKKYESDELIEYEDEEEVQDLETIKQVLKNVLEVHMSEECDEDLRPTLTGLLDQIVNDDGSLTYEDCVNIHETVKSLFREKEEGEESEEESKHRKKKKSSTKRKNKSSEDLKPSKKKRKENGNKRDEEEEGEIDDVYDDDQQFIVEKEYQDLLNY